MLLSFDNKVKIATASTTTEKAACTRMFIHASRQIFVDSAWFGRESEDDTQF